MMLDLMIINTVKRALGFPMSASTELLLRMGRHYTVEELMEGHLPNENLRLSRTAVGHRILHQIGWAAENLNPGLLTTRTKMLPPLPRNMNLSHHESRRQARAHAVSTTLGVDHAVIYTGASQHRWQHYAIIVDTTRTNLPAYASLKIQDMTAIEEAAIALALTQPWVRKIVTDSQQA